MGTSNFARGNTSRVFAVLMNEQVEFSICSKCGEHHYEEQKRCDNGCEDSVLEIQNEIYEHIH
jgi:predicted nucleic-acid-binding Zn-ribbon protein